MATNKLPSGAIPPEQLLLVEGPNDQHVIWNLAQKYDILETFSVEIAKDGGISSALESFQIELKKSKAKTLGIVIDADQNIASRWQAIKKYFDQITLSRDS
jgi:hypothetical protein